MDCKICGSYLTTSKEKAEGVCYNCMATVSYDYFEGGQLF